MAEHAPATVGDGIEVAVAHWGVNAWGGAEYLITRLAETLGVDRVYTLGSPAPEAPNPYGEVPFHDVLGEARLPRLRRLQARVDRVFEYALWEDVDWRRYGPPDVLVTSGATTRAVITPPETVQINYCHSPPRWFYDRYHDRKDSPVGILARPLVRYLRTRDAAVDRRVDAYLANSPVVARRIRSYYDRDSEVLYPPLDLDTYRDEGDGGYYVHLGRLDEQKGVAAVVDAFAGTDRRLIMAGGEGDAGDAVRARIARADNVEHRGFVDDAEKRDLLARCRALVFNGHAEDFGIVPVEANASGKPALVREEGFPGLFVTDGENGYHHDGSPPDIRAAIARLEREGIDGTPREYAERFSMSAFRDQLVDILADRHDRSVPSDPPFP